MDYSLLVAVRRLPAEVAKNCGAGPCFLVRLVPLRAQQEEAAPARVGHRIILPHSTPFLPSDLARIS